MEPLNRPDEFAGNDRFRLIRRIGAGGMGVVWEAFDKEHGRQVALKTLRTFSADGLSRFKNEFRALQDLHHENLVSLGELFEHGGHWFFTMELVHGCDFLAFVRPRPPGQAEPEPDPSGADTQLIAHGPMRGVVASTRPGPRFDEARLRAAMRQLSRGVHALHVAQKVHRDLKPSNILISDAGRVVVLDFGLITDAGEDTRDGKLVGTVGFMSPEQAAARPVGTSSDWYSVGVLLYLALTGRLPFDGVADDVIALKQRMEPIPPLAITPDAPRDLDRLCVDLLRLHPESRPDGADVLRRLDPSAELQSGSGELTSPGAAPFVGRRRELDELSAAFGEAREGGRAVVCIRGESGVGKSALAAHFAETLDRRAVVLNGRCYERESVPYKGVDGVVDELAAHLEQLSSSATALLPPDAALLPRVFPQLSRVKAIADSSGPLAGQIEPAELRNRVFAALRELLANLARDAPLVVVIDDYQWAGADSVALLGELLRGPEPPPLLFVTTVRSDVQAEPVPPPLAADLRMIELEGLPAADALKLADALLGGSGRAGIANAIASEAHGHPLFIDALARNQAAGATGRAVKLEEALRTRIDRLDPTARRLVEVVAVAGSPVQQSVAAQVAGLELSELVALVASLRGSHLVRTRGGRASDKIEPYHDRVRAAVLSALSGERRHELHRELALTLEANAGQADLESICLHWQAVGDAPRAARWAVLAAAQASEALAFDRAARLYQLALELRIQLDPQRSLDLQTRLAEALGNAGRGHPAARAYLEAARIAVGTRARELERRAAHHLLCSGHVDEGLATVERVLSAIGLRLPATPQRALFNIGITRARIRLRGLRIVERAAETIRPEQLERIDTCYSIASGLGLVDLIRGAEFQARHILYALGAGEPTRTARALALESVFAAASGRHGYGRMRELQKRAAELAEKTGDPRALAWVAGARGFTELQQGRWKPAHALLVHAEEILRERCTGVGWELASAQVHRLMCLSLLGELSELATRGRRYLRESEDRGDLFSSTMFRLGPMASVWLAEDDPEGGRRDTQAALARWSEKGSGFHLQHMYGMTARAQYALYVGDGAGAIRILDEQQAELRRAQMLRFSLTRQALTEQHARALVAWAHVSEGSARKELLARIDFDASQLERERSEWSGGLALLVRAGMAMLQGRPDRALPLLRRAETTLAAADMRIYELCARRRRGELLGGDEGRALVEAADSELRGCGARDPRKVARLCAPGF